MNFIRHPTLSDSLLGDNGQTYPDKYAPGKGSWALDEAWEILDAIKPDVIPHDVRAYLAGRFTGTILRIAEEGVPKGKEKAD